MNGEVELRVEPGGPGEENQKLVLEGCASTFGTWYPIGRKVEERVLPGAFKRTLANDPAVALRIEHDHLPLAHTQSGTMRLSENAEGLQVVADLNPRDLEAQSLRAKSENSPLQMSFAFKCNRDRYNDDYTRRDVLEASLHKGDISICCFGANPDTSMTIEGRAGVSLEERRAFAEQISGWGGRRLGWADEHVISAAPEPRGRSQIAVSHLWAELDMAKARRARLGSSGHRRRPAGSSKARSDLDLARAKRARFLRASMPAHPHVAPRYTYAEIQELGKEGKAHKRADGKYNFPIVDGRDLLDAILAIGRAAPGERFSVKRWIVYRAKLLGMKSDVPKAWVVEVGEAVPA